jgi:hypothetical protein
MFRIVAARRCALVVLCAACLSPARGEAATHTVPAGGDLQATLNQAQPGDVILLTAGATYTGNFRLPVKPGTAFITVRTDAPARDLPAPGVRMTPGHASLLAKIKSPNTSAALTAAPGSHHWRFELLEFQANANGVGDIIVLGTSGSTQTELSQMPHTLIFDRVYIHGDPVVGQKRGIALNSGAAEITNSHISDIKTVGQDTQAIGGWNGSGPYLIENNHLEAAGENVMFGGADPTIPNLVPSDITIRRNLFTKPLQWRQERWQIKNAFELKNARRVLIEGNTFEHVWRAAQVGFAVLFSTRNSGGRAPWSVVEDITFQYNIVRHAGNGINIAGYDDNHTSQQGRRYRIAHNIFYDISSSWGGTGIFLQLGHEPRDVVVEHNTVVHTGTVVSVYGSSRDKFANVNGFMFRNNLMRHNLYGVKGDGSGVGQQTFADYFANSVFEGNALAGGDPSRYPAGNMFPTVAEFEASFVNAAAGNFTLVPGSPFRTAASNGRPLGADVSRVTAALAGQATSGGDEGRAVCRPGRFCAPQDPYSKPRP